VAVVLGLRYAGEAYPRWLDQVGLSLARDWFPIPSRPARSLIGLFDPLPLAMLLAALAGVCLASGRRRLAMLAVAGPVVTGLATTVLKPVVERTKNGDLAYPSGHMGAAVALALVVALLLVSLLGLGRWASASVLVAVPSAVGAGMALSMTIVRYHYLTDAIGGFCVAVTVVLSLAVLLDRLPSGRPRADGGEIGEARNVSRPSCD
jgi:undecaprenyl-diphosphatase